MNNTGLFAVSIDLLLGALTISVRGYFAITFHAYLCGKKTLGKQKLKGTAPGINDEILLLMNETMKKYKYRRNPSKSKNTLLCKVRQVLLANNRKSGTTSV